MSQRIEPVVFGIDGETPVKQPIPYKGCGLDNIYLSSGFEQVELDGETFTKVEDVDCLHELITAQLCDLKRPLTGKEIRFLRKRLGPNPSGSR